jgi:hypothetical protein
MQCNASTKIRSIYKFDPTTLIEQKEGSGFVEKADGELEKVLLFVHMAGGMLLDAQLITTC